jgi:hypothetical protein
MRRPSCRLPREQAEWRERRVAAGRSGAIGSPTRPPRSPLKETLTYEEEERRRTAFEGMRAASEQTAWAEHVRRDIRRREEAGHDAGPGGGHGAGPVAGRSLDADGGD